MLCHGDPRLECQNFSFGKKKIGKKQSEKGLRQKNARKCHFSTEIVSALFYKDGEKNIL